MATARTLCAGLALLLLGMSGCAAIEHGRNVSKVAGRSLSVRGAEGSQWLAREAEIDPAVDRWLREHGRPDYLYVAGRMKLYFFYVERDRSVMFERELMESHVTDLGRIPGLLLSKLPRGPRDQIVARREAQKRRAKARARREAKARPAVPSPASAAPSGAYFGSFDIPQLAERMRVPMSAADPGVRGWRKSQLADGQRRWWAEVGGTRYELRPDSVTMASSAPAGRMRLTASARIGVRRVNEAVFAAKAEAVTRSVLPLMEQVLRDPSGRTRFSHRVAGRTVGVERLPAQGLLVYTVRP